MLRARSCATQSSHPSWCLESNASFPLAVSAAQVLNEDLWFTLTLYSTIYRSGFFSIAYFLHSLLKKIGGHISVALFLGLVQSVQLSACPVSSSVSSLCHIIQGWDSPAFSISLEMFWILIWDIVSRSIKYKEGILLII